MSWTDQRIDQLKNLWEKGLTASQIADELGGVSRNAVIGKAHRLGLKSRPSPVKANEAEKKVAPKKAAPAKPVAAAVAKPRVAPSAPAPRTAEAAPASGEAPAERPASSMPRIVSIGPGGFMRQGPGDQQAPIPPAPPRRLVPA
ncbi:MAG TPA: GcrA family cell cycle regulator, partial [Sphingorhabdus lacus]|nr:GcrA family cell cycle regulator [Sphingorhabdus lacus]